MSAVVEFVSDVVIELVDTVITIVDTVWDTVLYPVLETVMGWFGIKDEDTISTNVSSQLIVDDPTIVDKMMNNLALAHQDDPDATVIEKLMAFSSISRGRYNQFFNKGKNDYIDGLPTCNLKALVVDNDKVKTILGTSSTVLTSSIKTPTKEEYIGYTFQNLYDYKPWLNELTYGGFNYVVNLIDYNYALDQYDVTINSYEDVTTTVTTTTAVTITPYIEAYAVYNNTTQYYVGDHIMYDNGTTIDAYKCIVNTLGNLPTDGIHWVAVDYDNKNTTVTERTTVVGTKSGVISDVSVELSNVNDLVTSGAETSSSNDVVVTTTLFGELHDTQILVVPAYLPIHYYVVTYYTTNVSEWYYWLYDPALGTYPALNDSSFYVTSLDMLPVVTLRNSTVNVDSNPTSVRYKDSRDMLNILGVDIDDVLTALKENPDIANVEDAFIHFGVSPSDNSPIVSRVLFDMFDFTFNDTSLVSETDNGVTKYSATFTEGPMNLALTWTNQTKTIIAGVVGVEGTYNHNISGSTLYLRKQTAPEFYTEISLSTMASVTFIDRQGLWGTVALSLSDPKFNIPISHQFTKQMSGIDQTELLVKSLRLSVYAAQVVHLEWYETAAFKQFLQIVGVVIVVVVTIATAGAGASASSILYSIVVNLGIAIGISLAVQAVFRSTKNPWLRSIAVIAAIVAGAQLSSYNTSGEFLSAGQLTASVTEFTTANIAGGVIGIGNLVDIYTQYEIGKIRNESEIFARAYASRLKELDSASEDLKSYTSQVLSIAVNDPITPYIEGPDLMIYKARDIQYDFDQLYNIGRLKSDYFDNQFILSII